MAKIQMSKGKPIKLSTTHFVFLCQSIISAKNWLGKLFPWDGKGMEVKFELGRPPILEKHVFDLWGKYMLGNACPSHYPSTSFIPHPFSFTLGSLMQLKLVELSPSWFPNVSSFLHAHNSFSVLLGEWEEGNHDFGVWRGRFFPCEANRWFLNSNSWVGGL